MEADDLNECLVPRSGGSLGLRSFEEVFERELLDWIVGVQGGDDPLGPEAGSLKTS